MAPVPVIVPPRTAHTHTVVFLHGRGDEAENFSRSLSRWTNSEHRTLFDVFPSFRWVFPRCEKAASFSAGGDKVSQWFDIWNVRDFSDREEIQVYGLKESVKLVRRVLAVEAKILKGRWDRIVLAGFSQGAATATHILLNQTVPTEADDGIKLTGGLGAYMGFSCRMPFPGRDLAGTRKVLGLEDVPDDDEVIRKTPILLEHGDSDEVVLIQNGRVLRDTLREFGAQICWKEYPDRGHWLDAPDGTDDCIEFLTHALQLSSLTDDDTMDLS